MDVRPQGRHAFFAIPAALARVPLRDPWPASFLRAKRRNAPMKTNKERHSAFMLALVTELR
jgi:hypothetical protein